MAGGIPQLTTGVCSQLESSTDPEDVVWESSPIVQILQAKAIEKGGQRLWRVVISDGTHLLQAIVAPQLEHMFENKRAGKGTIVRVLGLSMVIIKGRCVTFISDLEVLVMETEKVGNPTPLSWDSSVVTSERSSTGGSSEIQTPSPRPSRYTLPIEGLSTFSNDWTIKARVTQKSEIRNWSNQRGTGKLFNVTFADESGEIRGTGFNEVVDQLYDKFELEKVYYISKAKVKKADKKFNNTSNAYELTLERNTVVEECADQTDVPEAGKRNFMKLDELFSGKVGSICDVIAIVSEVGEVSSFLTSDNRTAVKRELTLVDRTNSPTRLTIWGKQAENYEDDGTRPVIAFKGLKIGEFCGRTLSMVGGSTMTVNPDISEAHVLRGWYDSALASGRFVAHSGMGPGAGGAVLFNRAEARTIEDIKTNLHVSEKAEMFSCRGTILNIWEDQGGNITYPACPGQSCKKKLVKIGDGWCCEKCEELWEKPEHRYLFSMAVSDHTGQVRLQGFHDVGLSVFHMSADDLMEIKENDPERYSEILSGSKYSTFNFTCRAKLDTYKGQSRERYGISAILPLNYKEETAYLMDVVKSNWTN